MNFPRPPFDLCIVGIMSAHRRRRPTARGRRRRGAGRGRGEGGSVTRCGLGEPSQQWLMGLWWKWCVAGDEHPTPPLRLVLRWNHVCTPTASVDGVGRRRRGGGEGGGSVTRCGLGEPSQQWLMDLWWQWCVAGDEHPTPPLRSVHCWNHVCTPTVSAEHGVGRRRRGAGRGGRGGVCDAMRFG